MNRRANRDVDNRLRHGSVHTTVTPASPGLAAPSSPSSPSLPQAPTYVCGTVETAQTARLPLLHPARSSHTQGPCVPSPEPVIRPKRTTEPQAPSQAGRLGKEKGQCARHTTAPSHRCEWHVSWRRQVDDAEQLGQEGDAVQAGARGLCAVVEVNGPGVRLGQYQDKCRL
jgi:hypothetical protein